MRSQTKVYIQWSEQNSLFQWDHNILKNTLILSNTLLSGKFLSIRDDNLKHRHSLTYSLTKQFFETENPLSLEYLKSHAQTFLADKDKRQASIEAEQTWRGVEGKNRTNKLANILHGCGGWMVAMAITFSIGAFSEPVVAEVSDRATRFIESSRVGVATILQGIPPGYRDNRVSLPSICVAASDAYLNARLRTVAPNGTLIDVVQSHRAGSAGRWGMTIRTMIRSASFSRQMTRNVAANLYRRKEATRSDASLHS